MSDRATELRTAFDASFAAPPAPSEPTIDLLRVEVAGQRWAIPTLDLALIERAGTARPVPGGPAALTGLVAVRGRAVPVLDIAVLLGGAPGPAPRWLVFAGAPPVALGLDAVEGRVRLSLSRVSEGLRAPHVRGLAHLDDGPRAILDVARLVARVRDREPIVPGEGPGS